MPSYTLLNSEINLIRINNCEYVCNLCLKDQFLSKHHCFKVSIDISFLTLVSNIPYVLQAVKQSP